MFDNQSKTESFSHPPVAQFPLLLQPFGTVFISEEQLLQLIYFYVFILFVKLKINFTEITNL